MTPRIPPGYDSPRTNNFLASKQDEQIYVEPANEDSDNEDNIYKVPRSISNVNGSISPYATINHNQSTEPLDTSTRKESTNSVSSPKLHRLQEKICQFIPDASNSTLHKDPEPIYESTESLNDDGSDSPVYENTDFDAPHTPQRSPLPDAVTSPQPYITPENNRHKPRRHTPDDYEDLDNLEETFSASDREPSDDYEVMDGKVKEQIKRPTRVRASPKSFSSSQSFDNTADDYEDMDSEFAHRNSIAPLLPALDDYVAMDPKASVISSPRETAAPVVGSKGQQSRKAVPLAWRIANSSAIEGILKKRLHGTHSTSALLPPSAKKRCKFFTFQRRETQFVIPHGTSNNIFTLFSFFQLPLQQTLQVTPQNQRVDFHSLNVRVCLVSKIKTYSKMSILRWTRSTLCLLLKRSKRKRKTTAVRKRQPKEHVRDVLFSFFDIVMLYVLICECYYHASNVYYVSVCCCICSM